MRSAIAGDIIGSRFEGSRWKGSSFEDAECIGYNKMLRFDATGAAARDFVLLHDDCLPTDDSLLTIAVMDWIITGRGDLAACLRRHFRRSPAPEYFGKGFRAWAASDSPEACKSFGNGAAMRVSPVAFIARDASDVRSLARESALVTHQVDDAVAGAEAVALGIFLLLSGASKEDVACSISENFGYDLTKPLDQVRNGYEFTIKCPDTVPLAFRAFLEGRNFEQTLRLAISVGGDSDTIACMAGGLAGALWGLPESIVRGVEKCLDAESLGILTEFERQYPAARCDRPRN